MSMMGRLLPGICIAIAIATAVLLHSRTWKRNSAADHTGVSFPWVFAIFQWPALMLAPSISGFIPVAHEQRVLRTLDANSLYPRLTPALWLSMRIAQAFCVAGLALVMFGADSWIAAAMAGAAAFSMGGIWLHRQDVERARRIARELPAYLDLLTVCVEAGATLTAGVRLVVAQAPDTPLRAYFERVLREVRSGRPRAEAFMHVAGIHGVESLTTLASALAHAEGSGMSLGQILRTQSEQRTAERFARAERLAMQAPVKMLGPLILCIFPCTFIVLAVPIVVRMMEAFRS
jgi:tight adherence protein C